jgi:AraC-like DNA-binding protein
MRPISVLHRQLAAKTVVPAHSHGWGQLVYSGQGVLDVITPSGRYLLPPDRAVWVPPDEPHEISTLNGAEIASIYITAAAGVSLPTACQVLEISLLLRALILEALQQPIQYEWHSPCGRLFRTLRDQIAIAKPAPLFLPLPDDPRLLKICYQLQQQPEDSRTLAEWGAQVGASERTLQRLFQKQTRLTFQQWRQQLRLQIALQRLIDSRDSITAIALGLGYDSASTFIAMFHQQLGKTPGEYRKWK